MAKSGTDSDRELSLSPFIPNQPLVDDFNGPYFLNLDVDDLKNELIEKYYFSVPKPERGIAISTKADELEKKIADLHKAIKEREMAKKKRGEPEIKEAEEKIEALLAESEKTIQHIKDIEQQEQVNEGFLLEDLNQDNSVFNKENEEPSIQAQKVVVIENDSGSDMDISDDESTAPEDDIMRDIASDILASKTNTESEPASIQDKMDEDKSQASGSTKISYQTAKEELSDDDKLLNDLEFEQLSIQRAMNELTNKLNSIEDSDRDIQLKLSYLQVKMSMVKKKKEKSLTPSPRPGKTKRQGNFVHKRPQIDTGRINGPYYQRRQHYPQPIVNHYQSYYQPYLTPLPSSQAYTHQLPPPPPPPSDLPPPLSPPPPPPPLIETFKSAVTLRAALKTVEKRISIDVFNSQNNYPVVRDRPLPRPRRLVTIDDYTMTMNMIFLNKEYETNNQILKKDNSFLLPAGNLTLFTMTDVDYESPLSVLLFRKAQNKKFDRQMESVISAILISIPGDVDLSTFHLMRIHSEKLLNTYNLVCAFNHDYPRNHFLAALKLELSMYVHGPGSPEFQADFQECIGRIPVSVDLYWQYIIEDTSYSVRLHRFKNTLAAVRSALPNRTTEDQVYLSGITAELLIRFIRIGGIKDVIDIMTHKNLYQIDPTKASIFKLDCPSEIFLTEEDKYHIWMLIVHFSIMGILPQGVCDMWMNGLIKDGQPNMSKALFSIDWTDTLKNHPLDAETLCGATNIMLSMLAHFGELTCNNAKKKPLLIGVLRTLVTFLNYVPCYGIPGTLEVVKKFQDVKDLSPEIQEIMIDLELKSSFSLRTIISRLFDGSSILTRPQFFAIAYRSLCTYCEQINYTTENIVLLACILSLPLATNQTNRSDVESIIINSIESLDYEGKVAMVNGIRCKYRNLVSLGPSNSDQASTFVWINLLLLQKIYQLLCPVERNDIREEMRINISTGRKYLTSYDAQMLFVKYASELLE